MSGVLSQLCTQECSSWLPWVPFSDFLLLQFATPVLIISLPSSTAFFNEKTCQPPGVLNSRCKSIHRLISKHNRNTFWLLVYVFLNFVLHLHSFCGIQHGWYYLTSCQPEPQNFASGTGGMAVWLKLLTTHVHNCPNLFCPFPADMKL